MSKLSVYEDAKPERPQLVTTDGDEIARLLKGIKVRFERWQASRPLAAGAPQDEVLAAYRASVDRLMKDCGYQSVDVVSLAPDNPKKDEFRQKFLSEHTHSDDEVRFFVEGSGTFYLRAGGKVYMMLCEKGDLISVPANTRHWFDMGPNPRFICIRLFTSPEGWVASFTGDPIAERFPKMVN